MRFLGDGPEDLPGAAVPVLGSLGPAWERCPRALVYSLERHGRTTVGLRAGYTLLFREGVAHAAHAGLTIDHDFDDDRSLRLEVRDSVIAAAGPLHVVEVTVGLVLPARSGNGRLR